MNTSLKRPATGLVLLSSKGMENADTSNFSRGNLSTYRDVGSGNAFMIENASDGFPFIESVSHGSQNFFALETFIGSTVLSNNSREDLHARR